MGVGAHVFAYSSPPTVKNYSALSRGRREKRELLCQDFTVGDKAT